MPAAVMDNFHQGSPFSHSDSQSPQDWGTWSDDHRHHRREKNRDAARKSRKKQTEKADELHEELQTLEQSNAAFVKEIAALKKELQLYTTALEQHEPHCTKACAFGPSLSASAGSSTTIPSTSDFSSISDPSVLPDLGFIPDTSSVDLPMTDFFDTDWSPWDLTGPHSVNGCLQQL